MKIGLITIHKIYNYGSALQTYALQTKLHELCGDDSCRIIDYVYPNISHVISKDDGFVRRMIKICLFYCKNMLRAIVFFSRNRKFKLFWRQHYSLTKRCTKKTIKDCTKDFDLLVSGSDQIWNPRYINGDTSFMLDFAGTHQKCISYASSIGQGTLLNDQKALFKNQLQKFSFIGIRDSAVREELSSVLRKEVATVCDPTLLLSASEWDRLAVSSRFKNKSGYILLYILKYSFNPYPKIHDLIETVRQKYKLPVLTIYSDFKQNVLHGYKTVRGISVEDFLCLIKNASFVITTSFHGTCFSLIYQRNFYTLISDKEKDTRVYDLLKTVRLEDRVVAKSDTTLLGEITEIPWTDKNPSIENYVKKSAELLGNVVK